MKPILTAIIILIATIAHSAPYLTCDVDTNCEYYKVYADGMLLADNVPAPLMYDLVTMPNAGIGYTAECCNYRGCKITPNPFVSLDDPTEPQNMKLKL